MARRLFNGRQFSENGWPYVDQGSCTWSEVVPGVWLQIQNGPPLTVIRAFARDFDAHVERLRNDDSACWTEGNSVSTSNHPGGTSADLNWNGEDGHTFRYGISEAQAYPGDKARKLRELLAFYEGNIFCGGEWSIRDWMHFQMGGGTYDSAADRPTAKVTDFIARKIRADGYSTFGRANAAIGSAPILAAATGISEARAAQILPTVQEGLRLSDCNNVNRIAMWLAQMGHESASFVYTEEIQSGDESTDRWRYKGRTWIQITWSYNYADFSKWCFGKGLVPSPTEFLDNPKSLADLKWAGIGPAWYWTVQRPDINSLSDAKDIELVSRRINGTNINTGRANGIEDRINRYNRALAVGDGLLQLLSGEDDFLMALSADEQRRLLDRTDQIWGALFNDVESESPYAKAGGDKVKAKDQIRFIDASTHAAAVESGARLGDLTNLAQIDDAASRGVRRALLVLAELEQTNPALLKNYISQLGARP